MNHDPERRAADRGIDPLDDLLQRARWPEASADRANRAQSLDELLHSARWPDTAADPLSRCLDEARWPAPQADSLARCRRSLARVSLSRKKRNRALAFAVAVAAGLLAAVTAWNWPGSRRVPAPSDDAEIAATTPFGRSAPREPEAPVTTAQESVAPPGVPGDLLADARDSICRPATPSEMLLARALAARKTAKTPSNHTAKAARAPRQDRNRAGRRRRRRKTRNCLTAHWLGAWPSRAAISGN